MEQIYVQNDENVEVFTVFSPQVYKRRTNRYRNANADKVVAVINHKPQWDDELELCSGDVIQVIHRDDPAWWFGRLQSGKEGFFPPMCVTRHTRGSQSIDEPAEDSPSLLRRGSMPVVSPSSPTVTGCTGGRRLSTPKLPRKESLLRALGHVETHSVAGGSAVQPSAVPPSHSLLHRVLSKSRRKSCPHITGAHIPEASELTGAGASGSTNVAYQPD